MGWRPAANLREELLEIVETAAAVAAGLQRARSTTTRETLRDGWQPAAEV